MTGIYFLAIKPLSQMDTDPRDGLDDRKGAVSRREFLKSIEAYGLGFTSSDAAEMASPIQKLGAMKKEDVDEIKNHVFDELNKKYNKDDNKDYLSAAELEAAYKESRKMLDKAFGFDVFKGKKFTSGTEVFYFLNQPLQEKLAKL